jgi:hypothetical protein
MLSETGFFQSTQSQNRVTRDEKLKTPCLEENSKAVVRLKINGNADVTTTTIGLDRRIIIEEVLIQVFHCKFNFTVIQKKNKLLNSKIQHNKLLVTYH